MFWDTFAVENNELDNKLNNPQCNLKSIVEDTHCFQEIRNSNEKLLN